MKYVPHPHAYEWHDGHTSHHGGLAKNDVAHVGSDLRDEHSHATNDQVAKVGVPTYAEFAKHYGQINKGNPQNIINYNYAGKAPHIENMLKQHGYKAYYAGGKYPMPDLSKQNYNTGHLMIWDPTAGGGGDSGVTESTDAWRKVHELAHALTYPELNKVYGEGRRIGKLGTHRTPNEAKRAVHWEWLAAHKQRELSKQLGVHLTDEQFNKELNTVMHDALHRAVTGRFTEPAAEGFVPHGKAVPLEHALGMIDAHAKNMGIGDHELVKRKADSSAVAPLAAPARPAVMAVPKFKEVSPEVFEQHISKMNSPNLDQERDYTGKKTYLSEDGMSGYALGHDGYFGNLFSFKPGYGKHAVRDAISRGASYGNHFDDAKLAHLYGSMGFVPERREANWTPGGPDVVHVRYNPHMAKSAKVPAKSKTVKKPTIPGRHAKPKASWKSKDGITIPAGGTPARSKYDARFKEALVDVFAYGNPERVREIKVPTNKLANTNMPVNKDRLELYRRMAAAGERLPPVVVRAAGNGVYHLVDGNHRHTAAVENGYKHLDALEIVDPNAKPMRKNEDTKKVQTMWLGKHPVLHPDHTHDLETRAAVNEFDRKMPREEAEVKAHKDYMSEHHAVAAAHHLSGMKAAQSIGNMDEAKKHSVMYGLHVKALGHDPVGPVPPEVATHHAADEHRKVYKFRAHKADRFLLGE